MFVGQKNHSSIRGVLYGFCSDRYGIREDYNAKTSISFVIRRSGLLTTMTSPLLGRNYLKIKTSAIADRPK
jgi:hypothetical protein